MNGTCRFCGQMAATVAQSEEEANEIAERMCTCQGAREQRELEEACEVLERLFGEGNVLATRALSGEQIESLRACAEMVVRDRANSAKIDLGRGDSARIGRNGKGELKIKRERKLSGELGV